MQSVSVVEYWSSLLLVSEVRHDAYEKYCRDDFSFGNRAVPPVGESIHKDRDSPSLSRLEPSSTAELRPKTGVHGEAKPTSMPPASVMTRLILIMVWRKLIRNPNTYSSLIGLVWSLVSFRWETENLSSKNLSSYSLVMNNTTLAFWIWYSRLMVG